LSRGSPCDGVTLQSTAIGKIGELDRVAISPSAAAASIATPGRESDMKRAHRTGATPAGSFTAPRNESSEETNSVSGSSQRRLTTSLGTELKLRTEKRMCSAAPRRMVRDSSARRLRAECALGLVVHTAEAGFSLSDGSTLGFTVALGSNPIPWLITPLGGAATARGRHGSGSCTE